jgi:acyl-coenzyme A synthetase/AMP-(fatty) acid ligase
MRDADSQAIVSSASTLAFGLGHRVNKLDSSIYVYTMASATEYQSGKLDKSPLPPPYSAIRSDELRRADTAVIFHSSGSTGFPKGLPIPHERHLVQWPFGKVDITALTVSPLFHAYAGR